MMKIQLADVHPFVVNASALRQVKARDGEAEGGWRLDLIVKNAGRWSRSKIRCSLRYYDKNGTFLGLDTPYWQQCTVASQSEQSVSLYVDPPAAAEIAELHIISKSTFTCSEGPWWSAPLLVALSVAAYAVFRRFTH